ncbi:uncharacterized protein OCT59_000209 [Rhizophagus irregularis]|uniref:uncharacterized protein n=1 Tax=Rhizophagus irregularis TaxID=588596 RepID=UPI0033318817|nr:hypothetical protein OCT59_000209 [Rhizophagus irregularis]
MAENNPKETFILHDEPPYANGNLHIDIINRYKVLHGYKVKMRLSIELKALKELRIWKNPYRTLDNEYEVRQLQVFHNMMKKGYIHRQNKPVHWFPSSSFS